MPKCYAMKVLGGGEWSALRSG